MEFSEQYKNLCKFCSHCSVYFMGLCKAEYKNHSGGNLTIMHELVQSRCMSVCYGDQQSIYEVINAWSRAFMQGY